MRANTQARPRLIGVSFLIAVGIITVALFAGLQRKPFEPSARTVVVEFESAAQLHSGDQVRLEGEVAGRVAKVAPSPKAENGRVTLSVEKDAGPIYADANARLRVKTLLGGAFYVDLQRGTPGAGALGEKVITTDRTSVQTEVEDITDVFREDAATGMQTLPREFARALADAQPPADAVRTFNRIARDASVGMHALRGRRPGQDLPRLVHSASKAAAALDTPTEDLRAVVAGAAATLATTGRRSAELRQAIAAGPGATYEMTNTLARLDGTLDVTRGLIRRLDRGVPLIAPTLKELRPTLTLAHRTLRNATPVLRDLPPALRNATTLGKVGDPVVTGIEPSLKRLDRTILPYFGRKDPIDGYSTTVMVGGFLSAFAGIGAQQDEQGHFVRFPASVGASSLYLPCSSSMVDPAASAQLACDSFNTALETYLSYFPPLTGGPKGDRRR